MKIIVDKFPEKCGCYPFCKTVSSSYNDFGETVYDSRVECFLTNQNLINTNKRLKFCPLKVINDC